MKWIVLFLLITGCAKSGKNDSVGKNDSPQVPTTRAQSEAEKPPTYSNARFQNVNVYKLNDTLYRIRGQAQIFEASFSWIIEDGHNELNKGFEMTDAGAPEWGKFDFTVGAKKHQKNSTLTLILFETSAKDGSRQYELPIVLE